MDSFNGFESGLNLDITGNLPEPKSESGKGNSSRIINRLRIINKVYLATLALNIRMIISLYGK